MKGQRRLGSDLPQIISGVRGPTELPETDLSVSQEELLQRIEGRNQVLQPEPLGVVTLQVQVDSIDPSPFQPRIIFTEDEIEELANSIQSIGLVRPIIVRPVGGRYELVGGERRWRAHRFLGMQTIRAEVRSIPDEVARVMAVTDNEGQVDLTDYEKARAYKKIMLAEPKTSLRNIARRLSVNPGVMARILQLNELPEGAISVLEKKPDLITKYRVKDFLDVAANHPNFVVEVIEEMAEKGLGQDEGLKLLAKKVKGPGHKPHVPKAIIKGIGELKLTGKTMSLKFPKDKDPQVMFAKIHEMLAALEIDAY